MSRNELTEVVANMTEAEGRHRFAADEVPVDESIASTAEVGNVHDEDPGTFARLRSRWANLLTPTNGVWFGLAVVAAGFSTIFYSWGKVAASFNVALQMPYLISAGITGLALVVIGIAAIDVAVVFQDRPERKQQVAQIERALKELRETRS